MTVYSTTKYDSAVGVNKNEISWSSPVRQTLLSTEFVDALGITAKKLSVTRRLRPITITTFDDSDLNLTTTSINNDTGEIIATTYAKATLFTKETTGTNFTTDGTFGNYNTKYKVSTTCSDESSPSQVAIMRVLLNKKLSNNFEIVTSLKSEGEDTTKTQLYITTRNLNHLPLFYNGVLPTEAAETTPIILEQRS